MNPSLDLDSLNTRIGRLFMVGIPGPDLDPGTEDLIRNWGLGGVILFSRNIEDPVQVARLCKDLQKMSLRHNEIPLFLAVDQEGGRVARLRAPFREFPGQSALGDADDPVKEAREFARVTAAEMQMVGLNMDLTPVLDVPRGSPEKHLRGRTFSEDPGQVALLGRTVIRELQKNGIMAVGKHFPGLGGADRDPHKKLPLIPLPREAMEAVDIPPFKAAVDAGVTGIMSSHALYPSLDPEKPATLSSRILHGLLRDGLGFQGPIITDDLEMGAISRGSGVVDGAVEAFQAGADILLICADQQQVVKSMERLRTMLITGEIELKRFRESLDRIAEVKERFLKRRRIVSISEVKEYFGEKGP
ncbi:MAG: beta-N-acetylhexosaminidase [Deltaproteobacteria bacterium]|nr:beta-N-acetylhexosaminidase [Deltaproteobacteria bacterium]